MRIQYLLGAPAFINYSLEGRPLARYRLDAVFGENRVN